MKKFITVTVLAIMIFNVGIVDASEMSDVRGHWSEQYVSELVLKGAISGYPDGTFRPNNTITRAEFASVLQKALGLDTVKGNAFPDTKGHWAQDSINTLVKNAIIKPDNYSKGFGPNGNITRLEIVRMIPMAIRDYEKSQNEILFTDIPDGPSFVDKPALRTAIKHGVLSGYPDGTFRANGTATRAEATTIIINVLRVRLDVNPSPTDKFIEPVIEARNNEGIASYLNVYIENAKEYPSYYEMRVIFDDEILNAYTSGIAGVVEDKRRDGWKHVPSAGSKYFLEGISASAPVLTKDKEQFKAMIGSTVQFTVEIRNNLTNETKQYRGSGKLIH